MKSHHGTLQQQHRVEKTEQIELKTRTKIQIELMREWGKGDLTENRQGADRLRETLGAQD